MSLTYDEIENLKEIKKSYERIETLFNQLGSISQDEILDGHTEKYTLNHCNRWGLNAVTEILEDNK